MMLRSSIRLPLTSIVAMAMSWSSLSAAELKVLSDGPLKPALERIADDFRRETGHQVQFVFGTSPVIDKKVSSGEPGDVVIIQPNFVDELAHAGKVVSNNKPVIGRVGIGLAERVDGAAGDISTVDGLKQALIAADAVVINNVASGNYFAKLLEQIGIAETIKAKIIRTSPADVFDRVVQANGKVLGVGTVPLIIADKRLKMVGSLPAELQSYIVYTAVPMTGTIEPEVGDKFIGYLSSPGAKERFAAAGVN
jgi:molybdate transport system substrate-binding protein